MEDSQKLVPENIINIKDEYFYCTNNLIYKGNKSEIYKGNTKSDITINTKSSFSESVYSICIKKELPFLKFPELDIEFNILNYLQQFLKIDKNGFIPCPFVPIIYNYYHNEESPSFLIEKLYGNSLNSIFKMCKRKFTLMSSLILIQQMLGIIRSLHEKGIIHRNLNPNKFLFGKEETSDILLSKIIKKEINVDPYTQLYLIDYSSAKFYIENLNDNDDINKKKHIEFDTKVKDSNFTNKYFCSIWAELKMEQSRRDDLYSLFYIMIYLFKGKLPWMDIKCKSKKDKREKIRNMKLCLSNFELTKNINNIIINEVELFGFYLNGLSFDDEPNYAYLNQLLNDMEKKIINSKNQENSIPMITIRN